MDPSRRELFGAAGTLGLVVAGPAVGSPPVSADPQFPDQAWLQSVLERYHAFGVKASGGAGDEACGAWLAEVLGHAGYTCQRHPFEVPFFETERAELSAGELRAPVTPQALVAATGPDGLAAPLQLADRCHDLTGAIALIELPYKRWVTLVDPQVARPLADAFQRGAAAAVLVTNGPTRETIALNVSTRRPGPGKPVALLAPKDAQPFLAAAAEGRPARLIVSGRGGRRPAFNLIARRDRGAAKTLILSTPRSGWFGCAAERGSGLAVWLSLAEWLARADLPLNLELVCTSGHEYEYLGGERYLAELAPKPVVTRMWVHIGASAAARDWHEFGPKLRPLPSADSQRVLTATPDVVERVRAAFQGVSGLEATYVADQASAGGELTNVLNAGYASAIGLYGIHRYFHTPDDDMGCVSGELVAPVAAAFHRALKACLAG